MSPFTDVRFEADQVFVTYEGEDYEWLELDHLSVANIVASSKEQFGSRWQKRVAEDLVEVLWGMPHDLASVIFRIGSYDGGGTVSILTGPHSSYECDTHVHFAQSRAAQNGPTATASITARTARTAVDAGSGYRVG